MGLHTVDPIAPSFCIPLADISYERLATMFRANILGTYLRAREAVRRMSRHAAGRGGAFVNVSSLASRTGEPGEYVDYAGAKAAMEVIRSSRPYFGSDVG